ncbi:MAG: M24 family metallopeptidase [Candidatus Aminicenantes bacterium]|nr:M24 family metallopeptidase [Candidatus Aminicenantes bacterium]
MRTSFVKYVFILFLLLLLPSLSPAQLSFEKSEYAARRAKLMDLIPDGAAIILGAQDITGYNPYFQNNDFMYFSGVEIPQSILIINGKQRECVLFFTISERHARAENISMDLVSHPEDYTGIEKYYPIEQFAAYLSRLTSQIETIYTSFKPEELMREGTNEKLRTLQNNLLFNPWDGRLTRELQFVKLLQERLPQVGVMDCSGRIAELRMIKSPAEIELLREAGRIGVKAHIEMMKATRPGIFEYELAALFEYICMKEGAQDIAYVTIISSEENHPYLHYHKHNRLLGDGDFLVVDAGPDVDYYDVDISASYPANGKFTSRQREIYEACNEIEKACISLYRPGITCQEVNEGVKKILAEKGYDLTKDVFKIMIRGGGCSHSVGMAVHDVGGGPRGPLKPGMVFACDILAVFPDENLGVRVEDTVLITEEGCENLTAGMLREIEEIEALMKQKGIIQMLKENKLYFP